MAYKPKTTGEGDGAAEPSEAAMAAPVQAPIDPIAVMLKLAEAIESLKSQPQTGRSDELMLKLAGALDRLGEAQVAGSKLIADETRRAHRPSNEVTPGVSVFNRRGALLNDYQKPRLKCLMLLPWLAEWESLTREEVELLNLLQPGEYVVKRIDHTKLRVTVTIDLNVDGINPSRLVMNHETGFNNDNFRLMPGLSDMLRQVLKQHDSTTAKQAAAVLTDEEEEAAIEAGELSVSV